MSNEHETDRELRDAMAEALASVERNEKGNVEGEQARRAPLPSAESDADIIEEGDEEQPSEAEQLRDQLMRVAADFENYRKRASRQMDETRRFGAEKVLTDLLPVIDNLERALAHAEGDKSPIVEGVRMVAKQFVGVLEANGVRGFSSLGQPFDPERHEAMGQAPAGDQAPGTVLEEMVKGYFLHDRLLRPAQVIVAAPPREDDSAEG